MRFGRCESCEALKEALHLERLRYDRLVDRLFDPNGPLEWRTRRKGPFSTGTVTEVNLEENSITVTHEPVKLSPEIEAQIAKYGEGDPAFANQLRARALAMKASGAEDDDVVDGLVTPFLVDKY